MGRNGFFGVSNLHIALCTDESDLTYLKPYHVFGAVEVKATPNVQSAKAYGDNGSWLNEKYDNGGSGTISVRDMESTDELRKLFALISGYDIDEAGHILGTSNKDPMPFALMCQQSSKTGGKRSCFLMCRASKSSMDAKTLEDKPDIIQMDIDYEWEPVTLSTGWRGGHYVFYDDNDDYGKFFDKVRTDLNPAEIDATTTFGQAE